MKTIIALTIGIAAAPATILAQAPTAPQQASAASVRDPRYQVGLMESILQRAAEHGAKMTRDRARAVIPGDMLLTDDVQVRGHRLEGYGFFFDIDIPDLEGTLPWIVRTLDQNDLGLESALRSVRALIEANGTANDRQAFQRIEIQLGPNLPGAGPARLPAAAQTMTGSAASTAASRPQPVAPNDPIIHDPQSVYREEVTEALVDAILDHSAGLRLEPSEWLTVAARGREAMPRLSPADTESPTIQISVRGEDLVALLGRQISREEAKRRIVIKVF